MIQLEYYNFQLNDIGMHVFVTMYAFGASGIHQIFDFKLLSHIFEKHFTHPRSQQAVVSFHQMDCIVR